MGSSLEIGDNNDDKLSLETRGWLGSRDGTMVATSKDPRQSASRCNIDRGVEESSREDTQKWFASRVAPRVGDRGATLDRTTSQPPPPFLPAADSERHPAKPWRCRRRWDLLFLALELQHGLELLAAVLCSDGGRLDRRRSVRRAVLGRCSSGVSSAVGMQAWPALGSGK
jgi:hypothetical protein